MSAIGYPDYQRITQWLGSPLVTHDALVIGLGPHVDGPLEVANFAAVVVALKATGGNVTVTVKQTIQGGPAAVVLTQQVVVAAGATLFEAFVLYGTAVEIDLAGSAVGTSVDYALYGSNTTTNAQVITAATINVQQNDVLVAAEPTLDLEDNGTFVWSVVDDASNTRVKITPPQLDCVRIADTLLVADAASIDFQNIPQAYANLFLEVYARGAAVTFSDLIAVRFNNDSGNDYDDVVTLWNSGAPGAGTVDAPGASGAFGWCPGDSASANEFGGYRLEVPHYANALNRKIAHAVGHHTRIVNSVGNIQWTSGGVTWNSLAAINRITVLARSGNLRSGSRATLYGLR